MIDLAKENECTGCFACKIKCEKQAIQEVLGEDGFYYPEIDSQKCIQCKKCIKVCPVLNAEKKITHHINVSAAYTKDKKTLMSSSSGGVFSELAKIVIEKKGRVYGAAYDENQVVNHISVTDLNNLGKLRGAKYSQSNLHNVFKEIEVCLINGQIVLFSGTPCQVGGLKSFLGKEYPNLLCVDFICHGIPSPVIWNQYLAYRKKADSAGTLRSVEMRSKVSGWKNYKYSSVYKYDSGESVVLKNGDDPFMSLFLHEKINRLSCSNCHFKKNRFSDITIGDCWGIWNSETDIDIEEGVSLVIVNTEVGREYFKNIKNSLNHIDMSQYNFEKYNPAFIRSFPASKDRMYIIKQIIRADYSYFDNPDKSSIVQKLFSLFY